MKNLFIKIAVILLVLGTLSCETDPDDLPKLKVKVFGYKDGSFTVKLPTYEGAAKVALSVMSPVSDEVIGNEVYDIGAGAGQLPSLKYANDIRFELAILDSAGQKLASGATPMFDFNAEKSRKDFRIQVQGTHSFAPVGSVFKTGTKTAYAMSKIDSRGKGKKWLGRLGHGVATLEDGRVLIVGGGDPVPGTVPGVLPSFRSVHDDIYLFDPETGYFSDIDFDDESNILRDSEKLAEPVVYPTLTAIGENRFLVTGGFTKRSEILRPVNTIQIIDFNQPVGSRVKLMLAEDGSSLTLLRARALHTATYRASDKMVVVAGGIGPTSQTDALKTFELIDVGNNKTMDESYPLQSARARHSVVVLKDGTIWLSGGIDKGAVVKGTETIVDNASVKGADMQRARFGHAAFALEDRTELMTVVGGFTTLEGAATDTYEIGKLGRSRFDLESSWKLPDARGGIAVVQLDRKRTLLVGGTYTEGIRDSVIDMKFVGLGEAEPFEAVAFGKMVFPRIDASATLLTSGRVLIVGGAAKIDEKVAASDSAELYNP